MAEGLQVADHGRIGWLIWRPPVSEQEK